MKGMECTVPEHVRYNLIFVYKETGIEYEKCLEACVGENWAKCKSKD